MNEFMTALDITRKKGAIELRFIFPYLSTFCIYDHLTDPDLITRWWAPKVLKLDFRKGGEYQFFWSETNQYLYGKYTDAFTGDDDMKLAFTWNWKNDPDNTPREVQILLYKSINGDGSFMQLSHKSFDSNQDFLENHERYSKMWISNFQRLANYWGKGD